MVLDQYQIGDKREEASAEVMFKEGSCVHAVAPFGGSGASYLTIRKFGRNRVGRLGCGGDFDPSATITPNTSSSSWLGWILSSRATSLLVTPSLRSASNTLCRIWDDSRSAGSG